jgi:branched-chain amino acid transport system permease protein
MTASTAVPSVTAGVVPLPLPLTVSWTRRNRRGALHVAVLAGLAALPFVASGYAVGVAGRILAFGLLAASLDLLVGVAGLPSLGHAACFGAGAYSGALVARNVTTLAPVQLVIAALIGGLAAAVTGLVTVRSRGVHFLMLTLAIGELARQLTESWVSVTGGTNGLAGVPALRVVPGGSPVLVAGHVYWYVLAVVAVAYLLLAGVRRSPFGAALRGLRDNEDRMRALGYSVVNLRLAALAVAGAGAGLAGSLWVTQLRFVSPTDVGFTTSALALLTVIIGGRGALWRPFAAAALVLVVRDELGAILAGRGPLVLGLLFIAVVYLLPDGAVAGRLATLRGRSR